jgi:hypothetical protein
LQDVSVDFSFNVKELYGQNQFPLAVARSTAKVTGEAKLARISARTFADLFFGQPLVSGQQATSYHEAATVPAATPFTVTVANAVTFVADLGVTYALTGLPLQKVASTPAQGQYSVAANACISTKLTVATKLEDWTIPELDFSAFADASGTLGKVSLAELS